MLADFQKPKVSITLSTNAHSSTAEVMNFMHWYPAPSFLAKCFSRLRTLKVKKRNWSQILWLQNLRSLLLRRIYRCNKQFSISICLIRIRWRRLFYTLTIFRMEIDWELCDSGFVWQNVPLYPINQDLWRRFFSQLLIIIIIVNVVAYSDKLLTKIRACQQKHCHTNNVLLTNLGWVRRICLQNDQQYSWFIFKSAMLIGLKKQCKDSLKACLQYKPIISNIDRPDQYTLQQLVISLILSRPHIDEFPFQICDEENTWLYWHKESC